MLVQEIPQCGVLSCVRWACNQETLNDIKLEDMLTRAGQDDPGMYLKMPVLGMCANFHSMRHPSRVDVRGWVALTDLAVTFRCTPSTIFKDRLIAKRGTFEVAAFDAGDGPDGERERTR